MDPLRIFRRRNLAVEIPAAVDFTADGSAPLFRRRGPAVEIAAAVDSSAGGSAADFVKSGHDPN